VLNIQTAGTTAISIDASQAVTFTNGANLPNTFGFKNRIINGAMVIDQRNAGNTVNNTTANLYTLDRWAIYGTVAAKFRVAQSGMPAVNTSGFSSCIQIYSLAATTVSASDIYIASQAIEGYNFADMLWGTASAQTCTLSFWVYSTLTGTFGGYVKGGSTYTYPFTYTVSSANTWTKATVTIPGQTAGTWPTTTSAGVYVGFSFGTGSTYVAAANSWAGGDYYGATGQTQFVSTSAATMYITGVQLEKGATATSFDYRPYGTELALCQRYYQRTTAETASATFITGVICSGATSGNGGLYLIGVMRTTPTLDSSAAATFSYSDGATGTACTAVSLAGSQSNSRLAAINFSTGGGLTLYRLYRIEANSSATAFLGFSSEL